MYNCIKNKCECKKEKDLTYIKNKCECKKNKEVTCIKKYVPYKDLQIECMKEQCSSLISENNMNIERYKQLLKEIDNMYILLENVSTLKCECSGGSPIDCPGESSTGTCSNTKIFKYKAQVQIFSFPLNVTFAYISAVGGGGAGGVGFIKDMYYYSGGGGGAGSCIIKKPIKIVPNTIVKVIIGKGGVASKDEQDKQKGGDTIIEFIYPNGSTKIFILKGGWNGHPYFSEVGKTLSNSIAVKPGEGGKDDCGLTFLSGSDGCPGTITIPSQIAACGGKGGSSLMGGGGKGGGNYFSSGGSGGKNSSDNLYGENGEFGSGGGGSVPRFIHDSILSGNGGDGIVIIEW